MLKTDKFIPLSGLIFLICLIFSYGCQIANNATLEQSSDDILNSTVSVNFAPNGRLWRVTPSQHAVYVDYSNDNGKTYIKRVKINQHDQKISAWPENPPAIEISKSGRINILYYADEKQKSTSFYSYSDDNGQSFSTPVLISDHAQTAMHYMDKMLVDNNDKLYLFWHDTRHDSHQQSHKHDMDAGVLSLYYSVKNADDDSQFNSHFISAGICSCCRTATTFSAEGNPVILARMVYEDRVRDHALIRMNKDGTWKKPQRVTHDDWKIEACPEHGPSIAIDEKNRTHFAWFTLGENRQGIFYAHTDNNGVTVSEPLELGNVKYLPSHPDVIALKNRVMLVWKEFDGQQTTLHIKESHDRGESWTDITTNLFSKSKNSHPKLITNNTDIFLSWTSKDKGHQVIKL